MSGKQLGGEEMFVTGLRCLRCGVCHAPESVEYVCACRPNQGSDLGTLNVEYDYAAVARVVTPEQLRAEADRSIGRFWPLLPIGGREQLPPLPVGGTPLLGVPRLRASTGLTQLWVKDDGRNPSASLKDRASAIAVARARREGRAIAATASTGNAAAALAGQAAAAGQQTVIFVPKSAPPAKIAQLLVYGSTVLAVEGSYDDAFDLCTVACRTFGWYNRSTGYNPYMTEGKKTVSYEIALQLAEQRGWPLRCFASDALAAVPVPNPSAVVLAELGTASVAEAAALLAAGPQSRLLQEKRISHAEPGEQGAATMAIAAAASQWAPQRGQLHLVGSGPGQLDLLTPDARRALAESCVWVGYGLYLDLLEPLRRPDQLRRDGQLTQERERCREALELACQGLTVALVSSGESGIYGMAGLALEQWQALAEGDRPGFSVHPGISALQLAAARAGAPLMHDFCTISLSDRLTPWEVIERRLQAAASGDFVVALYNPRSRGRDWQLARARTLLLEGGRPGSTPVVLARQLGRSEEAVSLHTLETLPLEQVDMLTLVLVGNSSSRVAAGRMVTPRGYPGAELS